MLRASEYRTLVQFSNGLTQNPKVLGIQKPDDKLFSFQMHGSQIQNTIPLLSTAQGKKGRLTYIGPASNGSEQGKIWLAFRLVLGNWQLSSGDGQGTVTGPRDTRRTGWLPVLSKELSFWTW